MHGGESVFLTTMFVGFFAMVFGIAYLRSRQNMAMIEKGMNPKEFANRPAPYKNLKWALLLIGAGAGLLLAFLIHTFALQSMYTTETFNGRIYKNRDDDAVAAIYFALIAIGGGLGLFGSYKIEKKWWDDNKEKS